MMPNQNSIQLSQPPIPMDWGAWIGVGLGASDWSPLYLDLTRSELTFALLGRTLGRLGVGAVLIQYGVVVWRAFAIALLLRTDGPRRDALAATRASRRAEA